LHIKDNEFRTSPEFTATVVKISLFDGFTALKWGLNGRKKVSSPSIFDNFSQFQDVLTILQFDDKMNHNHGGYYETVNIKLLIITLAKSWKTWTHSLLIQLAT